MRSVAAVLLLGPIALGSTSAFAATRYIAQAAGTFSGGKACNGQTAITPATFNALTNAPGDVDYVCGTITVPAQTTGLIVNGSGNTGNPIIVRFDSGAVLESAEWPADGTSGAIDIGGNSYITIDGNGGASGATQGVIQATLNGDPGATCLGGPCTHHGDSNGIEAADGATNIVVQGLSIIDMYVATNPSPGGGTCIYDHGNVTNWTITGNLMHDVAWCINLQYDSGTSSGLTVSNNHIYNIDHGIALGGPHAGNTLSNVDIHDNDIHDYSNWDTGAADVWHHDGIHIWGYNNDGSDTITGVDIHDNEFGGCIGQNVTAHIFIETNAGNTQNVAIFDNALVDTCGGADNDGLLTASDPGYQVYNNTFIGAPTDTCVGLSGSSNVTFVNNVVSGCGTLQYITSGGGFATGGLHNNIYANCAGSNCFVYHGNYSGAFSDWQSETGQDTGPSAYVSSAGLSASGIPQSGSPVIDAGANLTSLCSGALVSSCSDIEGNARPATGAWTVGAYDYGDVQNPDAGASDGGPQGGDGATSDGASEDGGNENGPNGGGCGCEAIGARTTHPLLDTGLLLIAATLIRRKRARRRAARSSSLP